jgi:membrane-bound ClpP family serine protease
MILDISIIVFLFGAAILLILSEIFLIPGITIAGITGALFAAGGLIYAYMLGTMTGHIALFSLITTFGITFAWLLRAKSFVKFALKTNVDSTIPSGKDLGIRVGDEGVTISRLTPTGKALIKDIAIEVKSTGDFINELTPVVVIKVDRYNVFVMANIEIIHSPNN